MYIIAEVGSNWKRKTMEKSREAAISSVRVAAECGANAVKFQLFRAETLYSKTRAPDSFKAIQELELPLQWLPLLKREAEFCEVDLWITPFAPDLVEQSVEFVNGFKVASGDINHKPLLDAIARENKPTILSSGAALDFEVRRAFGLLNGCVPTLSLLNCVSCYPARSGQYSLGSLPYADFFDSYGLSDHTLSNHTAVEAIRLGYEIFEKHFHIEDTPETLPDRVVSLGVDGFKKYHHELKLAWEKRYRTNINKGDEVERIWARRGPDELRPDNIEVDR